MTISMSIDPSINARVTRQFSASPQRVFDAWLDSRTAGKWLFATARGQIVCVEIDARAGGWFYIVERRDGENVEHIGEYLEIVRPHRLVFTLSVEKYSLDFERVSVVFEPRGTGCELSLTHKTKPELATQVSHGWIRMLEGLAAVVGESSRVAPPREIAAPRRGHERMA
ncbi:MAG TPA: SRPBCC domain-containing protein [Xanthobacteraceae bacterium]|nr:SRPBCC domain-containing protein [Xanthobacteraceae bacterium]